MRLRLASIVQPKNPLDYLRKSGRDFQSSSSPPILAARMPVTNEFELKSLAEGAHWPSEYDRAPRNALAFHTQAVRLRECTDAREIFGESTVRGSNSSRVKWRRSAIGVLPSSSMSGNRPDVFEPRRTTMVTSMISFGSAGPTLTAPARAARSLPGNSILVFFVAMTPSLIHVSPERTLFRSQSTGAGVSVKISGMPTDCAC